MFCLILDFTFLMTDAKIKGQVSFESSEKKETFACVVFSKICYVACAINRAGKLICLCACLMRTVAWVSLTSLYIVRNFNGQGENIVNNSGFIDTNASSPNNNLNETLDNA